MKNESANLKWFLAWVLLWVIISPPALAQSLRIAVAGDPSLANLVDVTTGEFSKDSKIVVLDRTSLDKLGQEQALQAVMDSKDFSPVRLLPVDGLVLLRSVTTNGKTSVFARLVAVQPGVILREVALPDGADPVTQTQVLVKEFSPYWPKLATIQKGKIAALSLLGLRFEVDEPETREVERSMNILLASRLSAEPDTLVLERWRLNEALFEKSLSPQQPSPFWTGSSLLDGSMKWEKGNNRIDVTLRVRPPQGPEVSISDSDTRDNLPALAGRLADGIQRRPLTAGAWQPTAEASHYSELGKWCLDNRLYEEGAEALESALALGDNSRTTHMMHVKAYAMLAYPDDLHLTEATADKYRDELVSVDSLPQRVAAATRAARLAREYMEANRIFPSFGWNPEDPVDLGVPVLNTSLRILWAAYDHGFQDQHSVEMADLRHELQGLIKETGTQVLPQRILQRLAYVRLRAFYAGLWNDKPEDTLAFYREMLSGDPADGADIRRDIFRGNDLREPRLDGDGEQIYLSSPLLDAPWIVSWEGRTPEEVTAIWRNFLKDLTASSDPVIQGDALKFEFSSDRTVAGRNEVLSRFVPFLQQHTDVISGPQGDEFIAGCSGFFEAATQRPENAALRSDLTAIYLSVLKQHHLVPPEWIFEALRLLDGKPPRESIQNLLAALDDYGQWYQTQTPQDAHIVEAIARIHEVIYRIAPELKPAAPVESASDFLSVNRFWSAQQPDAAPGQRPARQIMFDPSTMLVLANNLWFMTTSGVHEVLCVNPATMQTVATYPIPNELFRTPPVIPNIHHHFLNLEVTPDWIVVEKAGQIFICSRSDSRWQTIDIPPSVYKPRWVNQKLYLLYDTNFGDQLNSQNAGNKQSMGSGLIHLSLPTGTVENLISSRRIPPQNTLDGHPLGIAVDLWATPTKLNLLFQDHTVYTSPLEKNDWSPLASSPIPRALKIVSGGALIQEGGGGGHLGQLVLLTDAGGKVLLSDTNGGWTFYKEQPVWDFPAEADFIFPGQMPMPCPIMRGEDLCLYYNIQNPGPEGEQACLYYFAKGKREGLKIPLSFDVQQVKETGSAKFQTPYLGYNDNGLQATDFGLILEQYSSGQGTKGFWIIPWSEVDAYRVKANSATSSPSPAATK